MNASKVIDSFPTIDYLVLCPVCRKRRSVVHLLRLPKPGEVLEMICDGCRSARHQEELRIQEGRQHAERLQAWEQMCPRRYRHFDASLFTGDSEKLAEALAWRFRSRGLVLHGHTGQGKTWAAFEIAKREHFAGRKVVIVNGNRLREIVSIVTESNHRYSVELRKVARSELLILNDPFKVKLTDKIEEALWEIVDERYEWARPIILTMNGVAANIEPLLSPDRGKALFRRLREENQTIHFPEPNTKK